MAFQPLKKVHFNEFGLSLLMSHLVTWANQFLKLEILDGRLVKNIEIDDDGISIEHKLGRAVNGWIIVSKDQNKDIWQTASSATTLDLDTDASSTMTISLWVF